MKNLLAFLTMYKARKAELDKLTDVVKGMQKELEKYALENYSADEKGKVKFSCGQYIVSISPVERTDIDKVRLEKEQPEIFEQYKKTIEYNRTTVK